MAEVEAGQHAPQGTKRAADTSLESDQRLSKRFDLLNLVDQNGTRLYIPVPGSTDTTTHPRNAIASPHPLASTFPLAKAPRKPRAPRPCSDMDVEDTPHRVYISDLAAELSDIESDEENPIFLSDIEKHLSKIPKHVLTGPEPKANEHNQMVLYNVPASLSVPADQDNVRKAIVEARQRIRTRQANPLGEPQQIQIGSGGGQSSVGNGKANQNQIPSLALSHNDNDNDTMDID